VTSNVTSSANPQSEGLTLVSCQRLIIQYIRSYLPHLEAVSVMQPQDASYFLNKRPILSRRIGGMEVYLHALFELGTRWRWVVSFTPRPL